MTTSTRGTGVRIDFRADPLSPGPDGTPRRRPAGVREASAPVAVSVWQLQRLEIPVRRWLFRVFPPESASWPARAACLCDVAPGGLCVLSPGHTGTHLPAPRGVR